MSEQVLDDDTVELSNLNRQILHTEATIGMPKAISAARAIASSESHGLLRYDPPIKI